jgi:SSS family solute:Na+ symporter
MSLFTATTCDVIVFFAFLIAVLVIGIGMSRRGKGSGENSESYFLAGRGLAWWLIGFSLIAANISTEQFVGMSGNAADYIGLAVASYEWIAALSLVIVGFVFLPKFLKAGVYTIPQFLETRYNKAARSLMAITMVAVLICVNIAVIIYSGAKPYFDLFRYYELTEITLGGLVIPLNLTVLCWIMGILAATYVFIGGLKACAWADLLQGSALILCGCFILYFALGALGTATTEQLQSAIQANVEQSGQDIDQAALLTKVEEQTGS